MYEYSAGKQDWITAGLPTERAEEVPRAGDVARDDVPTCGLDDTMDDVRERTRSGGFDTAVVVDGHRVVLGIIRSRDLEGDGSRTAEEAMRPGPSTFRPTVGVTDLAELMADHDLPNLPITTNDGRLVGLLVREDARRAAAELHEEHGDDA